MLLRFNSVLVVFGYFRAFSLSISPYSLSYFPFLQTILITTNLRTHWLFFLIQCWYGTFESVFVLNRFGFFAYYISIRLAHSLHTYIIVVLFFSVAFVLFVTFIFCQIFPICFFSLYIIFTCQSHSTDWFFRFSIFATENKDAQHLRISHTSILHFICFQIVHLPNECVCIGPIVFRVINECEP